MTSTTCQDFSLVGILKNLIQRPSVTPNDFGCQAYIWHFLQKIGFSITNCSVGDVKNIWAYRSSQIALPLHKKTFVFVGHTDVVPPGNLTIWKCDPFGAVIHDGFLYGRGAVDMKGSLAAFLSAVSLLNYQEQKVNLSLILTSDEEGPALHGTKFVAAWLYQNNKIVDYVLVGEPSCHNFIGDTIKIGRRGSLSGRVQILGDSCHIAYCGNAVARNLIFIASEMLCELEHTIWDDAVPEYVKSIFPKSSFQVSKILSDSGVGNMTPYSLDLNFNIRFCPQDIFLLKKKVENILNKYFFSPFSYSVSWTLNGNAFLCKKNGNLLKTLMESIRLHNNKDLEILCSTDGGTSDGRFFPNFFPDAEILEFGLLNTYIHKENERVNICDLFKLRDIYVNLLKTIQ